MRSCTRRPIARILLTALLAAPAARAEIAGEQVVSGTATFDQTGDVTTIHASDGAIIEYSQFDIWANEELHFVQPSSDSRVLNRVFGDVSHIDGGLYANGIVYIVNPAGIFFGPFAIVDVGGLYAAAGNISNEDFLAGIDRFTLSGATLNAGSIESPAVALLGARVANHGNIHAPDGMIALVAGEKVLLTQLGAHLVVEVEGVGGSAEAPAIEQAGTVDAGAGGVSFVTGDVYSLAINHTGITRGREILLSAGSGTVQVAGTLDASDRSAGGTGGSIAVTGERVALLGAQLDASGAAGGGAIRVGGDLHGEGALPTARRTYVDEGSSLRADAISSGDGGRVIVWSDEATAFHGAVSARGGAAGGDGGFAEISGAALAADGDVDLSAPSGATGTLLYDPKDIVLHAGTLDGSDDPDASDVTLSGASLGQVLFGTPDELTTPFDVYESELEGTNANIELQATNSISSTDAFDVQIIGSNSLTMSTRNDTGDELGTSLLPGIHLAGVSFSTTGGNISLSTGDGSIEVGSLTTRGADGSTGGVGGSITLTANDADQSGDSHVTTGLLDASGGDGGTGAGGSGGAVTVRSVGSVEDIARTDTDPTLGGGSITVAGIVTTGGAGATSGGTGGAVVINNTDGEITTPDGTFAIRVTGSIDTSGGNGAVGGNAGSIAIDTRDADSDGANHVTTAALIARGGSGTNGAGGLGGLITIDTRQSIEITVPDDPDVAGDQSQHEDPAGGGNIAIASIDTSGGTSSSGGNGGAGGTVQLETENGRVTAGAITTAGGAGAVNGAAGGAITLIAGDADQSGGSDVTTGLIDTSGGDGGTGFGGVGGAVTLRSIGAVEDIARTATDPTLGGGSITVAGVTTTGGEGGTSAEGGTNGGNGGNVVISTTDGAITASGTIDTSGDKGDTVGGSAGSIVINTRDANGGSASAHVITAALIARGGNGGTGAGGRGGTVTVNTRQSIEITVPDDPAVEGDQSRQEDPAGGGDIAIASVDTSGGDGVGGVDFFGNPLQGGGNVTITTESGDVSTGAIDSTGGAGNNTADTGLGGRGGAVTLRAGTAENATSDLHLLGNIDASEGASEADATITRTDGGAVTLEAGDDIEHNGQSGPHIRTGGNVSLTAGGDIGAASPLLIEGKEVEGRAQNTLIVSAGAVANVDVTNVGFRDALNVIATSDTADIHVTQSGGDVIDMTGSAPGQVTVNEVDTRASGIDVEVRLRLDNEDEDPDGALVLATGASPTDPVIRPGGAFQAWSDGDIIVGNADGVAVRASATPDPDAEPTDPITAGLVFLAADQDHDGTGGLRSGSDGAVIDMLGDADEPGDLVLYGSTGVGLPGDPILVSGGGNLSTLNEPLTEDPENEGEFIPNPAATTGIHVRNVASAGAPTSDLTIAPLPSFGLQGAVVLAGTGVIDITNEVGDLIVSGAIDAKPADPDDGAGGDVTLAVSDSADEIVLDTAFAIESGGEQTYNGNVVLARATSLSADGGVEINGGLDTKDDAASPMSFTATLGDEADDVTPFSVSGGIGTTRALGSIAIRAPDGGDVALDTSLVRTTGSQSYGADLDLAQQMLFEAGAQIAFDKDGDQSVTAGTGGFTLDAGGSVAAIPSEATIAKANGDLTLASAGGPVIIGDGDKLSVAGSLAISAPAGTVRFIDLSALDISVTSPDAQVFARTPGPVATPSGATVLDGGTDLVANTVAFSTAPTVVGGGPTPRIATSSGTAQNAGPLSIGTLPVAISAADIASGSRVFDLAIPAADPGHETQEIPTGAVEPPIEPQPSPDRAAPGAPVSREEVAAFFACAPLADQALPGGCEAAAPAPAYGSALDTERAVEVARAYRELLGDSASAVAGRAALARAAADPRAEFGSASSPAGRVYLTEVARVLGQVRLLGLGERYGEVRADLLAAVAAAIGSPQLDAARLGAAVDARAMGMPIQASAGPSGG